MLNKLVIKILVTCLFLFVAGSQAESYTENKVVVLECGVPCFPEVTISNFLKTGHVFSSKSVMLKVEDNGLNVLELSLEDYLTNFWIPNDGYPTAPVMTLSENTTDPVYGVLDAPLDCRYDPDYSCSDWYSDYRYGDYLIEAQSIIFESTIRVPVTQAFINSNAEGMAYFVTAATYVPAGRLASFIARYGQDSVQRFIFETISGTFISGQLAQLASQSVNRTLVVGDVIVFSGGGVSLVRTDGTTEVLYNGQGSGSDAGGGIGGGGSDYQPPAYPPGTHLGGGLCNAYGTVCTGGGCSSWVELTPCDNHP
ncbi:hypothetical protein [Rheinheimera pacifica]|uniref:hypothetical protein n=1 Tax=Rheinheimera pacifica TaxID=173990 RepID=UPI002ED85CBE